MARLLAALAVPALLMSLAPAAPVPKGSPDPLYYPTRVGARWVYRYTCGAGEFDRILYVTDVRADGPGWAVSTARDLGGGRLGPDERIVVSAAGVYHVTALHGGAFSPPFWPLKLPPGPGAGWEEFDRPQTAIFTLRGPETVAVPAGEFRAVRVERRRADFPAGGPQTEWCAPGVGPVRSESGGVTLALKSFTPGTGTLPPGLRVLPARTPADGPDPSWPAGPVEPSVR